MDDLANENEKTKLISGTAAVVTSNENEWFIEVPNGK